MLHKYYYCEQRKSDDTDDKYRLACMGGVDTGRHGLQSVWEETTWTNRRDS